MKVVAEFSMHFEKFKDTINITAKGSKYKIPSPVVSKYKLLDSYTVVIDKIIYPKGIADWDFTDEELDLIEKVAVDNIIGT